MAGGQKPLCCLPFWGPLISASDAKAALKRIGCDGSAMSVSTKQARPAFIQPEAKLKNKAMTLDKGLGLSLGADDLTRIESAISEHSNDFSDKILERLRNLRRLLGPDGSAADLPPEQLIAKLRDDAYEIKSLGATFGFPAMTMIAKLLHDYVDKRTELPRKQRAIAAVHVDALYVVLAQQLSNLPMVTEQALVTGLAALASRFP